MEIKSLKRVFKWKDKEIEDPIPDMPVRDVVKYLGQQYPELLNCTIVEDKIENDVVYYNISVGIGTKG